MPVLRSVGTILCFALLTSLRVAGVDGSVGGRGTAG